MNLAPYQLGFSTLDNEADIGMLPVRGTIPSWLKGSLLRTTPAKFEVGEQCYNHWFDGLAMLYKFAFSDGHVSYGNRFLQSHSYREAMEKGKISRGEFATEPWRTVFERVLAFISPKFTDNCNVSINKFANDVVALTESPFPVRFDPVTLKTLGVYQYEDRINGQIIIAHPHFDFLRMCHYSYVLEFGRKSKYHFYSVAADTGRRELVGTVTSRKPAYAHSFGMTERYLVLAEFPLVVNPLKLLLSGKPFIENYDWEPERGIIFHIIDKETGQVVKSAQGAPFFAFHHVNAFEERGEVVVDIVTHKVFSPRNAPGCPSLNSSQRSKRSTTEFPSLQRGYLGNSSTGRRIFPCLKIPRLENIRRWKPGSAY